MFDGIRSRKKARKALQAREKQAQSYLAMGEIDALHNTDRLGAEARGNIQQGMLDRGLYNTTALDNAIGSSYSDLAAQQGRIRGDFAQRKADLTTQFAETPGDSGGYAALGSALGMFLGQGDGADKSGVDASANAKPPVSNSLGSEILDSSIYTSPADRMSGPGGDATLKTATMTQAPAQVALMSNRKAAGRRRGKVGGGASYGALMT